MADTSLFENRLGILIWKTSNFWQSSLRKILISYNVSLNEYLVLQSLKYLSIGKWSYTNFKKVFYSKNRSRCAPPAPACGLYLKDVKY